MRLRVRQQSEAVRLEVQAGMGEDLLEMLVNEESLHVRDEVDGRVYSDVYHIQGMLDMTCMWDLIRLIEKNDLRDPPHSSPAGETTPWREYALRNRPA